MEDIIGKRQHHSEIPQWLKQRTWFNMSCRRLPIMWARSPSNGSWVGLSFVVVFKTWALVVAFEFDVAVRTYSRSTMYGLHLVSLWDAAVVREVLYAVAVVRSLWRLDPRPPLLTSLSSFPSFVAALWWRAWSVPSRTASRTGRRPPTSWTRTTPKVPIQHTPGLSDLRRYVYIYIYIERYMYLYLCFGCLENDSYFKNVTMF